MPRSKSFKNCKNDYSASGVFYDAVVAVTVEKHRYKRKNGSTHRAKEKRRKTDHSSY